MTVVAAVANAELTATANRPKYDGRKAGSDRLDNCWMLGKDCGQEAAGKYCQINGYQKAKGFKLEKASPTQTLVGQRCTGSVCVAFKSITCTTNAKKPGLGEARPQLIDEMASRGPARGPARRLPSPPRCGWRPSGP